MALRSRPAGAAPNRLVLRWLKTVVVSDKEKAQMMCQVGTEKVSESESLLKCRKLIQDGIRTGDVDMSPG